MKLAWPLAATGALALAAFLGAQAPGLRPVFGVAIPYAALAIFLIGLSARVVGWARAPVPFRVPTTCGQQKALSWIPSSKLDNPSSGAGALGRMLLEVLFFRSLFRNTKTDLTQGGRLVYGSTKYLWIGAMAFHWSLLVVLLRHFRFFAEPVPRFVTAIQSVDGFFQVGIPVFYLTGFILVAALGFLLLRRLVDPKLRYLSLPADYFALFLLLAVALSGLALRYVFKTDVVDVKELAIGLAAFRPEVPAGLTPFFFVHLFLVSVLFAYFPFSKLVHMGGVFLSPTRNLANTNRRRRHLNPWNPPIVGHTYAEWEEEFRDKIKAAGLPLDRSEP